MSGVRAFVSSMRSMSLDCTRSRPTERPAPVPIPGSRCPLIINELNWAAMPRIWTNSPSPWSRVMDTPGIRLTVSAALLSG